MLSGETASGKYPVEAVKTMAAIAEQAERDKNFLNPDFEFPHSADSDITEFLARNAIEATRCLGVKGIITDSKTGRTARNLAAFRGPNPVLAICYEEKVQRFLALSYGVIPVAQHELMDPKTQLVAALRMLRQKGYLTNGDRVAHLSGNFGMGGGTSYLELIGVQEVFDRLDSFKSASVMEDH